MAHKATYEHAGPREDVPEFSERIPPEIALELCVSCHFHRLMDTADMLTAHKGWWRQTTWKASRLRYAITCVRSLIYRDGRQFKRVWTSQVTFDE